MPDIFLAGAMVTLSGNYKPGDMPPSGYLDWHEWAEVQHKAGLRQVECGRCGKWRYPQELSAQVDIGIFRDSTGANITISTPVCMRCMSSTQEQRDAR